MDRKEYYKAFVQNDQPSSPKPFYLGYQEVEVPFDSSQDKRPKSYYIFDYTFSGCCLFEDCGKIRKLLPGSVFLFKLPNNERRFFMTSGMGVWKSIYLEFDANALEKPLEELIATYGSLYKMSPEASGIKRLLAWRNQWEPSKKLFQNDETLRGYWGEMRLTGIEGAQVIYQILSEMRPNERDGGAGSGLINAFCEQVNSNLNNALDVTRIAKELSVSRSHLTRIFTEQTGCSPHDYIVKAKMRQACKMLCANEFNNKEIAAQLGLGSEFYFYRVFKRTIGMTPRQFRLSQRKEELMRSL